MLHKINSILKEIKENLIEFVWIEEMKLQLCDTAQEYWDIGGHFDEKYFQRTDNPKRVFISTQHVINGN